MIHQENWTFAAELVALSFQPEMLIAIRRNEWSEKDIDAKVQ